MSKPIQCCKSFASYLTYATPSVDSYFGKKLRIFDLLDNELCYIEQKLFKFMPEYDIFIAGSHTANVKKKFAFLRHDFVITSTYGNYEVEGDFWAHEFEISKNNSLVARISKQLFTFTDTYGVDIDDAQDQILNLALAIVVDMVCHPELMACTDLFVDKVH